MNCGIYQIKNLINNKVYIGSSINLINRKYKHFWMLDSGIHDNEFLQKSFNKYGRKNFVFSVIELCNELELIDKENYHISFSKSNESEFGYNLAKVNEFRRNTYNQEVKIKLSKYNLVKNGNINKFSLTHIDTKHTEVFDNLVDATNYLIKNGYTKGNPRNIRMKLSNALRGVKVNNGHNGSIRKTCYKHSFKLIN